MALDPTISLKTLTPGDVQSQAAETQLKNTQIQQGKQNLQKGNIGLQSDQLDMYMKKNDSVIQLLQGANDQNSWTNAIQQAQQMGLPTDHVPQQFNPAVRDQLLKGAVDAKTQMTAQAMAAYRGAQLGLKADSIFGGVDAAAAAGYPPMLGGRTQPPALPQADQGVYPSLAAAQAAPLTPTEQAAAPGQPIQSTDPSQRMGSLPASAVANTPADQDPIEAWKQANAQQSLSPATKPMDAAAIQQPQANAPAQQVAAMPVQQPMAQQPGETVQHARLRFQQQGGTQDGMIRSRMQATGEDYPTAASAIKNGIGMGNTVDANGKVVPRAGSLDASSQQAAAKSEGTESGKELGKQMETYRSAAEAAQGMDATLNAMKADSQKFRMGAWSETQGSAKSYLQALAQAAGVETPDLDSSLANQQAFTKSAMGLVMGGMQKVQGRAFGEMKAIQSAFPTQAMSKDGFDLVTSQIAGTNQYSEAMYQAANDFKQKNGTLNGFESQFQKNISPWAYVVKNMNPAQLSDLSKSLSGTPEGQKELHMIADQIDYATKSGYMK